MIRGDQSEEIEISPDQVWFGEVLDKGFGKISTEDLLATYDEYNQKIDSGEIESDTDRIMLGADAKALFPSLDTQKCARLVGEEFIPSDLIIEDVNYEVLAKYIAMNWDQGQIRIRGLQRVIPVRTYKFGPRPGMKSNEAKEPGDREEDSSQ